MSRKANVAISYRPYRCIKYSIRNGFHTNNIYIIFHGRNLHLQMEIWSSAILYPWEEVRA